MTNKNKKMLLWVGIPVSIGAYFIYLQIKRKKADPFRSDIIKKEVAKTVPADVKKKIASSDDCTFPITKGDGSIAKPCKQVWEIQYILNAFPQSFPNKPLATDGDFGAKTEAALLSVYGKKQIDSEEDLRNLYRMQNVAITPSTGGGEWHPPLETKPKSIWQQVFGV